MRIDSQHREVSGNQSQVTGQAAVAGSVGTVGAAVAVGTVGAAGAAGIAGTAPSANGHIFADTFSMFKRCLRLNFRSPDALATSIIVPVLQMVLFGFIFGGVVEMGQANYINFIVPAIMLISIAQSSVVTGINVTRDVKQGIVNRFRSMPIARSSVLAGHVCAAVLRSTVVALAVTASAFAIGFRPEAGLSEWLIVAGMLFLYTIAMTWIAVLVGLSAKNEEATSSALSLFAVLPYLSSGLAPVETLPRGLRFFAEHQPMTSVIDSARSLLLNGTTGGSDLGLAIAWWTGITFVVCLLALRLFERKLVN
jgi:ABC-2 type transport system permease protein